MSNIRVTIPSIQKTVVCSGEAQHVYLYQINRTYVDIDGTLVAKDVGEYEIIFRLKYPDKTTWIDGTTDDISLIWKIIPIKVDLPIQSNELYYDGQQQQPTWIGFNVNAIKIVGGTFRSSQVGIHKVKLGLISNNYEWFDGSTTDKEIEWEIKTIPLGNKPYFSKSFFHYNGLLQGPDIIDYDSTTMLLEGNYREIEVGDYKASIRPNNNYTWDDGSVTPIQFDWSILEVTVEKPYVEVDRQYNSKEQTPYDQ